MILFVIKKLKGIMVSQNYSYVFARIVLCHNTAPDGGDKPENSSRILSDSLR